MASVYVQGSFVDAASARVSAFDAGLQHGVGLFETMSGVRERAEADEGEGVVGAGGRREPDEYAGARASGRGVRILHLHEHLSRLATSARALGLAEGLRVDPLGEAALRTLELEAEREPGIDRFRVRLTLTGGDLNLLSASAARAGGFGGGGSGGGGSGGGGEAHQPTLMIVAQPATRYPPEFFQRGVMVSIADLRVNPLDPTQGYKTVNYWARLRELKLAAAKGAGEALVFQVSNYLAGGCVSNAMIVRSGRLITPIARGEEDEVAGAAGDAEQGGSTHLGLAARSKGAVMPSPVLPGVTRAWAMDAARALGLEVIRRMITIEDVLRADEVLLTNSSWGVLPVVRVEKSVIADGRVGEVAGKLVEMWGG